jgi:hypothetical protein
MLAYKTSPSGYEPVIHNLLPHFRLNVSTQDEQ